MWNYAGVIRDLEKIKTEAIPQIKKITTALEKIPGTNITIAETRNMAKVSLLILTATINRQKSLGCHFAINSPRGELFPPARCSQSTNRRK